MRHHPAPPLQGGALLAVLLLAACNSGDEPAAPSPSPSQTTPALSAAGAEGEPLTEGQWFIEESADTASAAFGPPASEPLLRIACDRNDGRLLLNRSGPAEEAQILTIKTGSQRASVQMSPAGTELPMTEGEIDPAQPIFAALSDPNEIVEFTSPHGPALRVPGHTGISRVVQACS